MTTRSGSAFLLCLALAAFAAMVGYAFLRGAARQEMSGKSEMLRALARDAAASGLAQAFEQILSDYNARSLEVATGSGPVTVTAAPNFLDGPYRAPFVSLTAPNRLAYINSGKDDVNPANHVMSVLMGKDELVFQWWHDYQDGYANHSGAMVYDSRGRYIEVNYHNVTRPSPVAANPVPVVATRFSDANAVVPERSNALFMDENLHRLVGGTVAAQRTKARYRLRYSVGVEDLAGHLLTNPQARMNTDWKDANNDYRALPRWVDHAANVLDNMVSSWNPNRAAALRLGHIFRGRGNASNTDRAWAAGPRQGLPATFPMMFRTITHANDWWGIFGLSGLYSFWGGPGGGSLRFEPVKANPQGGEILTPTRDPSWVPPPPEELPYVHALLGPQLSWFSQIFSLQGCGLPDWQRNSETCRSYLSTIYTPYGHAQRASSASSTDWKWYEGRVDTPWHVNLLTASPEVLSEMLLAYLPPYIRTQHWVRDEYYAKIGVRPVAPFDDIYSPTETLAKQDTNGGLGWDAAQPGLDILNDQLGAGFSEFPAPSSLLPDGVTVVKPDYYQTPGEPRPVEQRYPGPLCRSDLNGHDDLGRLDDLGKDIDVEVAMNEPSALTVGWCTHTYNPLLFFSPGGADQTRIWDETTIVPPAVPPPWPATPRWKIIRRVDPNRLLYKNSYFWDMTYAMSTAISYARAVWVQYPNDIFDPRPTAPTTTGFLNQLGNAHDMTLRDPLAYDTIEEIDALFLRQLGENYAVPGTRNPKHPIVAKHTGSYLSFREATNAVSNTIATLVAGDLLKTASGVSSAERGKVMERMLNDYRMSFFGASTRYVDFRPLDFDGDGKVNCSCYESNPAASSDEKLYRTNRWMPVEANGKGPSPSDFARPFDAALGAAPYNYPVPDAKLGVSPWFCASGCFFIGKSHYYRIFSRGDVYDNLLMRPVAQQTLETVLTVDPEAPRFPPAGRISSEQRVLFKQWHYNPSIIELPLQMR